MIAQLSDVADEVYDGKLNFKSGAIDVKITEVIQDFDYQVDDEGDEELEIKQEDLPVALLYAKLKFITKKLSLSLLLDLLHDLKVMQEVYSISIF